MSECEDTEENKQLIISCLQTNGNARAHILALCIANGKVHIGGCIPINERVNETLEKILRNETSNVINHATARKTFEKMEFAIKAGRKASRRYEICSREFNQELHMALTDMHYTAKNMGPDPVELAEMKVKQAEQRLEWAVNDLERKRSRR